METVLKNEGEVSEETGLVHPLTHNTEGENMTFYEAQVASRENSRVPSREPSQSGGSSGGITILARRESLQSQESFTGSEADYQAPPITYGFLDEPENERPELPVLQIFDKNECLIEWKGAGAYVTKNLHTLAAKYFPGVPLNDMVVIDNDPFTYNRNTKHAMPIETYWGSTIDTQLPEITAYLRDTFLPCRERELLDLQQWTKPAAESGDSMDLL